MTQAWRKILCEIYKRNRHSTAWESFSALHDQEDREFWKELDRIKLKKAHNG